MDFIALTEKIHAQRGYPPHAFDSVLAFDPGHTTGWAYFYGGDLINSGEIDTTDIGLTHANASPLFKSAQPQVVVMEDYRVYKWRQKHHVGSEMTTTRVIGALELMAVQNQVEVVLKQPANIAKGFCTDKKLKEWGFYQPGKRHARDAIRHGCYYMVFGPMQKKDRGLTVG